MATARIGGLAEILRVSTAGLSEEAASRKLASFARRERDRFLHERAGTSGVAPRFRVFVNGREGASEDTVKPPGPIVYRFDFGREAAQYVIEFLQARSPKDSGLYASSHRLIQGGSYVEPAAVRLDLPFTVVNVQPYSRKIEVGAMRMSVPPHVYEDAAQAFRRRYGNLVNVRVVYVELTGGYVLKGHGRSAKARKRAGQPMRYPALQVTPR